MTRLQFLTPSNGNKNNGAMYIREWELTIKDIPSSIIKILAQNQAIKRVFKILIVPASEIIVLITFAIAASIQFGLYMSFQSTFLLLPLLVEEKSTENRTSSPT